MTRPRKTLAERLYWSLLFAYPAEFRRTVGRDAVQAFGQLHRDEWRAGGIRGLLVLWPRSVLHVIGYGLRERWGRRRSRSAGRLSSSDGPRRRRFRGRGPEIRQVVRSLARAPGFSLTAVGIVALGVGATTTIYSVVDNVLLRPLPYPNPHELVTFAKGDGGSLPVPDFQDIHDRTNVFASLAAMTGVNLDLTSDGTPERLTVGKVTTEFFSALGAMPAEGRLFTPGDFEPGATKVAVVGHGLWRRRWGGDSALIGATIVLDGEATTVIGVVDREFRSPRGLRRADELDLWIPFDITAAEWQMRNRWVLEPVGRLAPGYALGAAQAELDGLAETLAAEYPDLNRHRDGRTMYFPLVPLHRATVGWVAQALYMLLGAVGLLLLIACANVANLFLARGTDREREIALRSALGAGRGRIVQQLLSESIVLALVGGALGMGMAVGGIRAFTVFNPGGIPRIGDVAVDWRVLLFAVALSTLTGVLFGLIPALQSARTDIATQLQEGARNATAGRHRTKLRNSFVVAEVALALVLLIGAGLLFNSFLHLRHVDPGVDPEDVTVLSLRLGGINIGRAAGPYSNDSERIQFSDALLETIRAFPNVQAAGATIRMPFGRGWCCWNEDLIPTAGEDTVEAWIHPVTTGLMEALGVTLVAGRFHGRGEMAVAAPSEEGSVPGQPRTVAAVINRALAEHYWPGGGAVGRELHAESFSLSVVGVVEDIRHFGLDSPEQFDAYLPYAPDGAFYPFLDVAVRSDGDPASLAAALRRAVWTIDPDLPMMPPQAMADRISGTITTPRFYSMLFGAFAAVAFLLAAAGIASSMLYSVGQRQRELGIRLALGAQRRSLMRMVVGKGLLLMTVGIGVGLGGAFALSRVLDSFVFEVSTTDPLTFVGVSLLLAAVAMVACYLPARKAAGADPLEVLRAE